MKEFKARLFEIEQGQNEVVLNEEEAEELGMNILDRVSVSFKGKSVIAIVDHSLTLVKRGEIGLFKEVSALLSARNGDFVSVEHAMKPASLDFIRKKLDGGILSSEEISSIISDLMVGSLSDAELACFVSGIYSRGLSLDETSSLINAIYQSGEVLKFEKTPIVSVHSIGGVNGDRTSIIITSIMASLGIAMPKTASRAISSASGTADTMEVLANVSFDCQEIQRIVNKCNGCVVWGGAVHIAPADDKLIKIRTPLRLDPKSLLLASILAKKKAEGAEFVLIDIPCGRGSKISSLEEARSLARDFESLGAHLGIKVDCVITDGSKPLINTIGPAFEARAVLKSLESCGREYEDLIEKSCLMAGVLLKMVRGITREEGYRIAKQQVLSGKAFEKFKEIIKLQGGNPEIKPEDIKVGKFSQSLYSKDDGTVSHIDNTFISRVCRFLGAPKEKEAGIVLKVREGTKVFKGMELARLYSNSQEKLSAAIELAEKNNLIEVERMFLEEVE